MTRLFDFINWADNVNLPPKEYLKLTFRTLAVRARSISVSRTKILVSAGILMCFLLYLYICVCVRQSCVGGNHIVVLVFRWLFMWWYDVLRYFFMVKNKTPLPKSCEVVLMMYYILCGLNRRLTTPTFGTEQLSEYFLHRTETICVWFRQFCTGVVFHYICFQQNVLSN